MKWRNRTMENLYGVYGADSIYAVVKAESKEKAFDIFAKNQINNKIFLETITEFITNSSLLENFYRDDKGSFHDDFINDYPERIKNIDPEKREIYVSSWIEKNIRAYWIDQPQFAEEYLRELHKSYESDDFYTGQFSEEFIIDTIKRLINTGDWYNDFRIVEIDFSKDNYQLIYED